jgi:hypothetical protein
MLETLMSLLNKANAWLDFAKPAINLLQTAVVFATAGVTSYSAIVINSLKRETIRLRRELDDARRKEAHVDSYEFYNTTILSLNHKYLHKNPGIHPNILKLARDTPSLSPSEKIIAVFDLRYFIDRSSVAVFTDEGLHFPNAASRLSWEKFCSSNITEKDASSIDIAGHEMSSDDRVGCFAMMNSLQQRLKSRPKQANFLQHYNS